MQTRERHVSRQERTAIARATALQGAASQDRAEIARLARELADMREDRDRWRAQAERLAGAVERLKGAEGHPAQTDGASLPTVGGEPDTLSGYVQIGGHIGIGGRQAKHLAEIGAIPTFKLPGSSIVRARRSTLNAWLAEREAAAKGGR